MFGRLRQVALRVGSTVGMSDGKTCGATSAQVDNNTPMPIEIQCEPGPIRGKYLRARKASNNFDLDELDIFVTL